MDVLDQNGFQDIFQPGPSHMRSSALNESKDSLMDILNIPEMLSEGFDHLAGLPLDTDDLELACFNEDFDMTANLALPDFEDAKVDDRMYSDTFSTIKKLWPDQINLIDGLMEDDESINSNISPIITKKPVLVKKQKSTLVKKLPILNVPTLAPIQISSKPLIKKKECDEESGDEVDIETVDDDELKGKSSAQILSQKLHDIASTCRAARVREVIVKKKTRNPPNSVQIGKIETVKTSSNSIPASSNQINERKLLEMPIKSLFCKIQVKAPEELPVKVTTEVKIEKPTSPTKQLSSAAASIIQSRRESLLRILPKGARIKPRSKDSSPSSVIEKIKQSSQTPRASILIPHPLDNPLNKSKSIKSNTAVVTPFITKPSQSSTTNRVSAPNLVQSSSKTTPTSIPPAIENVKHFSAQSHTSGASIPAYKLLPCSSNAKPTHANVSWNHSVSKTGLFPDSNVPDQRKDTSKRTVTLSSSQAASLLQNLQKFLPKLSALPSIQSNGLIDRATKLALREESKPLTNKVIPFHSESSTGTVSLQPLKQIVLPRVIKNKQTAINKKLIELDHNYCSSANGVSVCSSEKSTTVFVDPWTFQSEDTLPIVIDSEGVGEVVTVRTNCDSDQEITIISEYYAQKSAQQAATSTKRNLNLSVKKNKNALLQKDSVSEEFRSKVRRDSSSSMASSHRSKHNRSSCSPSNNSSPYSSYYRSRSRSQSPGYRKSTSRSRSRGKRLSRKNYRQYRNQSSSRSRSRSPKIYSRSRSRSWNRNRSWLKSSSRSSSRSRSPSFSRSCRDYEYERSGKESRNKNRRSASYKSRERQQNINSEQLKQTEDKRVIFVGKIPDGTTKTELRKRFYRFGDIQEVSVHFRDIGDNYGFVTFAYNCDAHEALHHGNDDPDFPKYELCLGGRRGFRRKKYADLDSQYDKFQKSRLTKDDVDFDTLLRAARAQLEKRQC